MAKIATVRVFLPNGDGRGNEVEGVISRFCADRVFPGFGHVAIDALTPGACRGVVRVFGDRLVIRSDRFAWTVASETESVCRRGFDCHGDVARPVRVVASGTLQTVFVHDAM